MNLSAILRYIGYAVTAIRLRKRIMDWLGEGRSIAEEFDIKFPQEEKKPTASDVIGALTESTAGRTRFTPLKVRDWGPQEWKNYWRDNEVIS